MVLHSYALYNTILEHQFIRSLVSLVLSTCTFILDIQYLGMVYTIHTM